MYHGDVRSITGVMDAQDVGSATESIACSVFTSRET
jgi:hypothetical protein